MVWTVEPYASLDSHHVHALQWGPKPLDAGILRDAAIRAGIGWAAVQRVREPTAIANYILKTPREQRPDAAALSEEVLRYLEINGGRLTHATPGFWRDRDRRRLAGVKEGEQLAMGGGGWRPFAQENQALTDNWRGRP
jgi:hypothetical protein